MARRWKILILIGLFVTLVDQYTKFLAVKHLTPGIAMAHARATGPEAVAKPITEQEKAAEGLGLAQELVYFYGDIKAPCARTIGARCPTVQVVDGFWNWRYVENPGAAWGLLAGASDSIRVPFFIIVSLAAIVFILTFFRKLPDDQHLLVVSLSLVFGGAIGNFIDRLHLNYVIDFIDWYVGASHWPTFNFADAAITSGVVLLMLQWLREWREGAQPEATAEGGANKSSAS
ncbi:signal peptidase II [Myxococcota bacterium]|nr:signal peptidase II [Myxococcota bacterium]